MPDLREAIAADYATPREPRPDPVNDAIRAELARRQAAGQTATGDRA